MNAVNISNPDPEQDQSEKGKANQLQSQIIYLNEIHYHLNYCVTIWLITICMRFELSVTIIFAALICSKIAEFIHNALMVDNYIKINRLIKQQQKIVYMVFTYSFNITYLILLCVLINFDIRYTIISTSLIMASFIVKLIAYRQQMLDSVRNYHRIQIFKYFIFMIQSTFIALKLDGVLQWKWSSILWGYYVLLIILICVTLVFVIITFGKSINLISDNESLPKEELIFYIWFSLYLLTILISAIFLCKSILNTEDRENQTTILYVTPSLMLVFQLYSFIYTVQIKKFLFQTLQDELPMHSPIPQTNLTSRPQSSRLVPKIIQKISRTYYGIPDSRSPEIQHSKKPTHMRANSTQAKGSQVFQEAEQDNQLITNQISGRFEAKQRRINSVVITMPQEQASAAKQDCSASISSQICLICCDRGPNAVFMNCGHGGLCYECAIDIWKRKEECHLCRQKIDQVLQVNLCERNGNCYKVISTTQMVSN